MGMWLSLGLLSGSGNGIIMWCLFNGSMHWFAEIDRPTLGAGYRALALPALMCNKKYNLVFSFVFVYREAEKP